MVATKRRGHGEDAIYFDATKNRYYGAASLGFGANGKRIRRKVSGMTKQEVRDKLKELHSDLDSGVQSPASYTVAACVEDWLSEGLSGRSERALTIYHDGVKPLVDQIGSQQLRKLSARDVGPRWRL